jgi:hypothetical protein
VATIVLVTGGLGSSGLVSIPDAQTPTSAAQPPVTLNDVVQKRPLLVNVPLPSEISTKSGVIGTNMGLAILLAILFGIISTTLNNLIREEEATFRRWFSLPILRPLLRMVGWGSGQNVQQGCLALPAILVIFVLYGVIFSFLENGLDVFSSEGVQLTLVLAMSVGLISLSGDVARRQVARFWWRTARYGLYPANLLIAVVTTAFSRVIHLSPGVVFGVPGGVDIDLEDGPVFREVILAFTTLIVMVVLGALGWGAAAAVRAAGDQTVSAGQADFAGPLAQLGLTIGLALFLVAVETSFFEMVPLTSTLGSDILRWNPVVWFAAFTPVMFVFSHTLLNPGSEYLKAFENANLQALTAMIVVLGALTAALWFYFKVLHREPARAVPLPGPISAPPPPYARPVPPPSFGPPASRPAQPPLAPPTQYRSPSAPPPAIPPRREPTPPRQGAYVPPPIVISDNVPPPIVIDEPTETTDEDQNGTEIL